jgi:predicted outer membrane repeat protein
MKTNCTIGMMALVTCGLLMTAITVTANDFYVDVSWTGTESGTQTEPYTTIKAAVDAANEIDAEHNIYIAAGWYGDVANDGTEDYSTGGGSGGGINITRRISFYGGYAGWDGAGGDPGDFDWTEGSRIPRTTAIDLQDAGSRAFRNNQAANGHWSLFDGLSFSNALHDTDGGCIESSGTYQARIYVNDCLFATNTVTGSADGGAIFLETQYSSFYIRSSDFIDNTAGDQGGAVWVDDQARSNSDITDCTFSNNTANSGGAFYGYSYSSTILRTTFDNNTATTQGGAIDNAQGNIPIRQSVFSRNAAPAGAAMGRPSHTSWGGGYVLENCLIFGNTGGYAVQAEGVRYGDYSLDMLHCTVVGNTDGGVRFQHAGSGTTPGRIRNSIIAHNGAYGIYRVDDPYTLSHNNVYDNASGNYYNCDADEDSISVDPDFIDVAGGDYRLAKGSPCIDVGSDIGIVVDIDGVGRPTRDGYDMGCYEEWQLPVILNHTAYAQETEAEVRAEFTYESTNIQTYAYFVIGTNDLGTGQALTDWDQWAGTGEQVEDVIFNHTFSGLTADTTYYFRCVASNTYDMAWGPVASFDTTPASVATKVWTGAAGDGLASTDGNWKDGAAPSSSDYILLDTAQSNLTWDAGTAGLPDTVARWTQTDKFTATASLEGNVTISETLTVNGGTLQTVKDAVGGITTGELLIQTSLPL